MRELAHHRLDKRAFDHVLGEVPTVIPKPRFASSQFSDYVQENTPKSAIEACVVDAVPVWVGTPRALFLSDRTVAMAVKLSV